MGIREYSLAIAVGTPSVGVPVVLGIYLYHGFSCAYVCDSALHWQKAWTSARGVRTLARDGARAVAARNAGVPFCEYLWGGAIPTVSIVGASHPECHPLFMTVLLIAAAFGYVGYSDLHKRGGVVALAAEGSCGKRADLVLLAMRALSNLSMTTLALAGVLNVGTYHVEHNSAAAGFYVTNIAHTLVLWRMQYVAARPIAARRASLSPAALERVLSFEERWCLRARESTLKDTMCVLWAIGTVGAAYVLRLTFTNMVWQSWFSRAAILEWVTTELVNTSVFMHAADHYRLCRMKERLTEKR